MNDDLLAIFHEEAQNHLDALNMGLMSLEIAEPDQQPILLKKLNRTAHTLRGAARSVGYERIYRISESLEQIFAAMQHDHLSFAADVTDVIYDGLDLIANDLNKTPVDAVVADVVVTALAALVEKSTLLETDEVYHHDQDSKEIPILPEDLSQLSQELLQQSPPEDASDNLIGIFWTEVNEHLKRLNDGMLQIEMAENAIDPDWLKEMNRVAHSMKGAARVVGFGLIEAISHYLEEALGAVQEERLRLTPRVADVIYDGLDLIQNLVDGNPNDEEIVAKVLLRLERLVEGRRQDVVLSPTSKVPDATITPTVPIPPALMTSTVETGGVAPTVLMRSTEDTLRVAVTKLDQLMADTSELLIAHMQGEAHSERLVTLQKDHARWQREWRSARTAYIRLVRRMESWDSALSADMITLFRFLESNQRYLANANRELNQLVQIYQQDSVHLGNLTDQLQDDVANLRMMSFDTIIGGFQRMVRDLARDLEKQVHLEIIGTGVEIDKTVLDMLKDPLMHLLRNAVDHGLELPKMRQRVGKSPTGRITLQVEQRGSEIMIRVRDDGHGLDLQVIRQRAVERGVLQTSEVEAITDEEARMLIFQSGFTTSKKVTALSGRGLGMDIVRTRVESLRGQVNVHSESGIGTTVTITVPLSLTRLRVIMLSVGGEQYAIPASMVKRMEIVPRDAIYTAEGQAMVTLNGQPAPLVALANLIGVVETSMKNSQLQVMALQSNERMIAFSVDALYREEELVLKALGHELMNVPLVAGAAILGAGNVIMVLDANELVRQASAPRITQQKRTPEPPPRPKSPQRQPRILVVDDSITTRTLEKNILETVGYEVHVAINGAEAWQRLPEIVPDVVITDVEMPLMTGFELTQRIKNGVDTRHIPVILLTSLNKPEQRAQGLQVGADAYLVKSRFDQGELLGVVRSLL